MKSLFICLIYRKLTIARTQIEHLILIAYLIAIPSSNSYFFSLRMLHFIFKKSINLWFSTSDYFLLNLA